MLQIVYRDEGGYVSVFSPSEVISFLNGEVYFDDGEEEYRIPVESLAAIIQPK